MTREKTGLIVGRFQPLHKGHTKNINAMIEECHNVIVALGSCQESGTRSNPFTQEQRQQMLRNVYGNRIKIVKLTDIGAANPQDWGDYVLDRIRSVQMAEPTDYYAGSLEDAVWYQQHFYSHSKLNVFDWDQYKIKDGPNAGQVRRLHILDRTQGTPISASGVRTFIETRENHWHDMVPTVNHQIINDDYPEELKVPLTNRVR